MTRFINFFEFLMVMWDILTFKTLNILICTFCFYPYFVIELEYEVEFSTTVTLSFYDKNMEYVEKQKLQEDIGKIRKQLEDIYDI